MTRQSTENASISSPENMNDCPLHGNNARQSVQEQIIAIDVVEALQHFNVPNDIIKVLRTYHAFLKTEADNSNDAKENRYKKSVNIFLQEFETMVSNINAERKKCAFEIIKSIPYIYFIFIIVTEYNYARLFVRRASFI